MAEIEERQRDRAATEMHWKLEENYRDPGVPDRQTDGELPNAEKEKWVRNCSETETAK